VAVRGVDHCLCQREICVRRFVSLTATDRRENPRCRLTDVLAKVCAGKNADTQVSLHLANDLDGMVDGKV